MNKKCLLPLFGLFLVAACGVTQRNQEPLKSGIDPQNFDTVIDGKKTALYSLRNKNGMEVDITNFGGRVVAMMVPDKDGKLVDVVLGFDNIKDYLPNVHQTDFGASIGRYANRIKNGLFVLDGDTVHLPQNNFGHTLHGGPMGWQYQVYDVKQVNDSSIVLVMNSHHNDNGFPGNVTATVTYTLTADNALDISYRATTDKTTVINMTNHCYFNLSGDLAKHAMNQVLYIDADSITPVDSTFMTTGEMMSVEGTPFDFRKPTIIQHNIGKKHPQIKNANGFDHNWVLNNQGKMDKPVATLYSPLSGILLNVYTNEPGIQFYSGNFLDGTLVGKNGKRYIPRYAICLETQHYPDSPNKPQWPSVVLKPGETYTSNCIYQFEVKK